MERGTRVNMNGDEAMGSTYVKAQRLVRHDEVVAHCNTVSHASGAGE